MNPYTQLNNKALTEEQIKLSIDYTKTILNKKVPVIWFIRNATGSFITLLERKEVNEDLLVFYDGRIWCEEKNLQGSDTPNGFVSWNETLLEIASHVYYVLDQQNGISLITKTRETEGITGVHELIINWAKEFENMNIGREWDGEFFEEIEKFVKLKNS